jgi:hypothetical protein
LALRAESRLSLRLQTRIGHQKKADTSRMRFSFFDLQMEIIVAVRLM